MDNVPLRVKMFLYGQCPKHLRKIKSLFACKPHQLKKSEIVMVTQKCHRYVAVYLKIRELFCQPPAFNVIGGWQNDRHKCKQPVHGFVVPDIAKLFEDVIVRNHQGNTHRVPTNTRWGLRWKNPRDSQGPTVGQIGPNSLCCGYYINNIF